MSLEPNLQIDEAKVRLECLWQESPPFRVRIHLVTPGPDFVAENRDHTLRAAAEKALALLEGKVKDRAQKRTTRLRDKQAATRYAGVNGSRNHR